MAASDTPSTRIKKGMEAFADIAKRVEELERQLDQLGRELREKERENESLTRELMETRSTEEIFDDLEDLRLGIRSPEELLDRWLGYTWKPERIIAA